MAARIIFCIEGLDACQYPSRVWNLTEVGPTKGRRKAVTFRGTTTSAFPGEGEIPYEVHTSDKSHVAILRDAIAEEAKADSTACFIVLLEDIEPTPVFHAERVSSPDIQASFDDNWEVLQRTVAKAA